MCNNFAVLDVIGQGSVHCIVDLGICEYGNSVRHRKASVVNRRFDALADVDVAIIGIKRRSADYGRQ